MLQQTSTPTGLSITANDSLSKGTPRVNWANPKLKTHFLPTQSLFCYHETLAKNSASRNEATSFPLKSLYTLIGRGSPSEIFNQWAALLLPRCINSFDIGVSGTRNAHSWAKANSWWCRRDFLAPIVILDTVNNMLGTSVRMYNPQTEKCQKDTEKRELPY